MPIIGNWGGNCGNVGSNAIAVIIENLPQFNLGLYGEGSQKTSYQAVAAGSS
jgi:hypothetical protein